MALTKPTLINFVSSIALTSASAPEPPPPAKVIEEGQKRIVKYLRYCKRHIQDYRSRIALLVNVILEHCNVVIDGDDDDNLSLISLGNLTISA